MPLAVGILTSVALAGWPELDDMSKGGGAEHDAAVIVGIEDYFTAPDIAGARLNAEDWYRYLTTGLGVPVAHVGLLRDGEGTDAQIVAAVDRAVHQVGEDGTLWFVFIGHGAPSSNGKDGLLVGVDAQQSAIGLSSRSLKRSELLDQLKAGRQANTLVILDACFSGRSSTGTPIVEGLQPMVPTYVTAVVPEVTLFTAAGADEFAGALPGEHRPAFSYLILGALQGWADADEDGGITGREASEYARNALMATVRDRNQTPELTGGSPDRVISHGRQTGPDLAGMVLGQRAATVDPEPRVKREKTNNKSKRDRRADEAKADAVATIAPEPSPPPEPEPVVRALTPDQITRIGQATAPVLGLPWNQLGEQDWRSERDALSALATELGAPLDEPAWDPVAPESAAALVSLYVAVGYAATNSNDEVPPFFEDQRNRAWWLAGQLVDRRPQLIDGIVDVTFRREILGYANQIASAKAPAVAGSGPLTPARLAGLRVAASSIEAVQAAELSEREWASKRDELHAAAAAAGVGMDDWPWTDADATATPVLLRLYLQLGRAAENAHDPGGAFYRTTDSAVANHPWVLAARLIHADPQLVELVKEADMQAPLGSFIEMLQ